MLESPSALDAWLESLDAVTRKTPPKVEGYLHLRTEYHCIHCGSVSRVLSATYRAEHDKGLKVRSLVRVETAKEGFPLSTIDRSKNIEFCVECVSFPSDSSLELYQELL